MLLSCGGGGGGGGGAAATGSSGPWGSKTTITIPFTKGVSRAGFSDGVMSLGWNKIDITITQTVNGTSEVVFEESIEEAKNVTVEVVTGSKIEATATIYIPGKDTRTAKGVIERVEPGKNTLTVYVPYNVIFDLNNGGFASPVGTWADGTAEQTKNINNVTKITIASNMPTVSVAAPYTFTGWNLNQNGTGAAFVAGSTNLYDGLTMYAQYKREDVITTNTGITGSGVFIDGRTIEIASTLWVCDHEVTQAEYQAIMGTNPSQFQGSSFLPATDETQENRPVEKVSWYAALVYCNRRSIGEGFTPCYTINGSTDPDIWGTVPTSDNATWNAVTCDFTANGYRLPTEAEWEYAARGGNLTNSGQTTYAGSDTIDDVAWKGTNSDSKTHEVKKKAPNGLGLYDMNGNVREWCWDWNTSTIQTTTPVTGPTSGTKRVVRGGYYLNTAAACAVSFRDDSSTPSYGSSYGGFRVVRTAE